MPCILVKNTARNICINYTISRNLWHMCESNQRHQQILFELTVGINIHRLIILDDPENQISCRQDRLKLKDIHGRFWLSASLAIACYRFPFQNIALPYIWSIILSPFALFNRYSKFINRPSIRQVTANEISSLSCARGNNSEWDFTSLPTTDKRTKFKLILSLTVSS